VLVLNTCLAIGPEETHRKKRRFESAVFGALDLANCQLLLFPGTHYKRAPLGIVMRTRAEEKTMVGATRREEEVREAWSNAAAQGLKVPVPCAARSTRTYRP
jgi:hypothetical protein